jgi:FtsZ-binding cell division protein ZapB
MADSKTFNQFSTLERKLQGLVEHYTSLKVELEEIKNENEVLRQSLYNVQKENIELQKNLNQQIKNFKKSDKFTKIAVNNLKSTGNPVDLKEKLDEYILEIEKCINQLSN